jgi:nucleotide-binding universal stress UspA family protein
MTQPPFSAIVVGIDGSRAAERAAQWAVDEAVGRDLGLHLLAACTGPGSAGRAEWALRLAAAAVAANGRPVPLTTEVVTGEPPAALQAASRTAAMVCVGVPGADVHDGSTVTPLVASSHCPLAVVRGTGWARGRSGWVVAELDETADSAAVLQWAVEEARLRRAPLRVLGTWQSGGGTALDEGNRRVRYQLDRHIETWKHRYPDLDVEPVAVHGSGLEYLSAHRSAIEAVVIGARNVIAVNELLGAAGRTALPDIALVILDRQRLL